MTDTKEFLKQGLLYPNIITNVSGMSDLIPVIDMYYGHLVRRETYSKHKRFKISMFKSDLDEFELYGDKFVDEFMIKYKEDVPYLTKDSVYSLLLASSIALEKINIVEKILSTFYEENILVYTESLGYSPIVNALKSGNRTIWNIIRSYIEKYKESIVKSKSINMDDYEELMEYLGRRRYSNFDTLKFYNEFLIHLYVEDVIIKIKERIELLNF